LNTQKLKLGDGKSAKEFNEEDTNAEFVGFSKDSIYKKLPVEEKGKLKCLTQDSSGDNVHNRET